MPLRDRQRRFVEEYVMDSNATQAAIRAGYSRKTAAEMGYENLRKPQIRAAVDALFTELSMSKGEAVKKMSDIASSALNEYFVVQDRPTRPMIKRTLKELIQDIENEITDADLFITEARITNQDRIESHLAQQEHRRERIVQYKIELRRNPGAYRIVQGPEVLAPVAELDMIKLVQDKQKGRIKTLAQTEFGWKVELYPADAALRDILKIHGAYAPEKTELTGKNGESLTQKIDFSNFTDEELEQYIGLHKKASASRT